MIMAIKNKVQNMKIIKTIISSEPTAVQSFSFSFSVSIFKPSRVALFKVLKPSNMMLPYLNSLIEDLPGDLPKSVDFSGFPG